MTEYRRWIRSMGYSLLSKWSPAPGPARVILVYHSIGKNAPASVKTSLFREQLRWLQEHYKILPLAEFVSLLSDSSSPQRLACITFDDGNRDQYEVAAPMLEKRGIRATFFIAVDYLRDQSPDMKTTFPTMSLDEVRDLSEAGHEIGSHTLSHPCLSDVATKRVREELEHSREVLERALDREVWCFAYPYGERDRRVLRVTRESGYRQAVTTDEALVGSHADRLQLPRIQVSNQLSMEGFKVKTSRYLPWVNALRPLVRGI